MIRRITIGVAVAAALLGGLGAATAVAAQPTPATPTSATVPAAEPDPATDTMIRQCTDQLPEAERGAAETTMREMMAGHDSASMHSMMGAGESMTA
ncbi:hypothetical protein [Rhodococcus marinonascens]|uniref:hypothetical protein n=1 Tax=Rhodococcus marinonascens TaxID=38311 RepID=UPI0009335FD3|nr:hypothetical protein [Rhodococcus marinonascens]